MLDEITVEQAYRMIEHLSGVQDEHRKTCDICYIDLTGRTCIFCRHMTKMLYLQGLYMERIREHERDEIQAID